MSTASPDFEQLLSEAINLLRAKAPRALDDLVRFSSRTAEAVMTVTRGAAVLELVPINHGEGATPSYQLQLRKVGSEAPSSDLGVYCVTAAGYHVLRWYSIRSWESHPDKPDDVYHDVNELERHFKWMLSKPDSRLVVLVTSVQQGMSPWSISAADST